MEKEIEINTTAYRRRNLYMEKKMHIDGKNYEVESVLPLTIQKIRRKQRRIRSSI